MPLQVADARSGRPDPIAISACPGCRRAPATTLAGSRNALRRSIWYSLTRPPGTPRRSARPPSSREQREVSRARRRPRRGCRRGSRRTRSRCRGRAAGTRARTGIAASPAARNTSRERRARRPHLREERREHADQGDLGDLRGRELEPARTRTTAARPSRCVPSGVRTRISSTIEDDVEEARVDLQEAVVEARDQHQHDRRRARGTRSGASRERPGSEPAPPRATGGSPSRSRTARSPRARSPPAISTGSTCRIGRRSVGARSRPATRSISPSPADVERTAPSSRP